MLYANWLVEGERRFGPDQMNWRFVCPVCGYVQSVADYKAAGAPSTAAGFSCLGRWMEGSREAFGEKGAGPCNYAGGGLFGFNPVAVEFSDGRVIQAFAFASEEEPCPIQT